MKAIEVEIKVLPDGSIQLPAHLELRPGTHRAVLVVEEILASAPATTNIPPLKILDWSHWPADSTFRREDLYGDDGH